MEIVIVVQIRLFRVEGDSYIKADNSCPKIIQERIRKYIDSPRFLRDTTVVLNGGAGFPTQLSHYLYIKADKAEIDWKNRTVLIRAYAKFKEGYIIPSCVPHDKKAIKSWVELTFPHDSLSGDYSAFTYHLADKQNIELKFPKAKVKSITPSFVNVYIPKNERKVCPLDTYLAGGKCFNAHPPTKNAGDRNYMTILTKWLRR
jgi:hypothetical protein